jgi:hypothetical protein
MGSLGDFGTVKPQREDTFGWFGHQVRVNPRLTDLVLMDFAEYAMSLDQDSPEVLAFMKNQMKLVVHPDDFEAFWRSALDNGQDSTDLMAVMKAIVETKAARPTPLPSDSSAGQARTVVTSPDVSSLPATAGYQETLEHTRAKLLEFRDGATREATASPLTEMDRRIIEAEAGRPDVALMVMEAARQRAAAN